VHPEVLALLAGFAYFLFISFAKKKRTKESCPATCFILRICYEMGRNLFRLFPFNNKYSGASWNGLKGFFPASRLPRQTFKTVNKRRSRGRF